MIDGKQQIRTTVDRVLHDAGYETAVAEDGPDALRAAACMESLDLLVTNAAMPEMSGWEVARRLREDHPHLKVLYVTDYSDTAFEAEEQRVMMWEDEAFVGKPCSLRALLEAVSLLWNQSSTGLPVSRSISQDRHAA
jgi:two-component system cell cycle sensor histidine kinase/response regulator CckA